MKKLQHSIMALCLLGPMALPAQAQEWAPRLESATQGEFRDPMETFRIYIPSSVPTEVLQTLTLELDSIDVTAMVSREGDYAVFTPVQALEWGTHTLRMVEYAEDGSIYERGYWEFQVRRSAVFREMDYAADINLNLTQRTSEKNIVPPGEEEPDDFTSQGSAVFQGRVADDDWQATGQLDLIYNNDDDQTANGENLDMGEYLITGQVQSWQASTNLGHHSLPQSSLVMEGFHRRGISGGVGLSSLNSSVSGFALRAEPITGFKEGLGVGDNNNRVDGIVWETQPFTENPEQLYLSATYLSGSSTETGESVGASDADQAGDAWSLVADSSILDKQLRLRGEVAGTTIDRVTLDTTDQDLLNESADAMSFSASYNPQPASADSRFFWNTGIEFSEIDTYFVSLANPNLPADKKLNRLYLNTDWNGLSAQLATAKETDNVDDIETLPRIETKLNQLTLNYSLAELPEEGSWLYTIGIPSVSLQYSDTRQKQIKAVLDEFGFPVFQDLDIEGDMKMLAANFNKETWSWGWSYSESSQADKINVDQRQITYSRGLNANVQFGESFVMTPSVQAQTTQIAFDSSTSDSDIYSLGTQFLFTDTMNGQINLNQSQTLNNSAGFPQDQVTDTLTLQLTWNWILPKNKRPGFDVTLSGSWQDTDDKLDDTLDLKTYQVFLSLVMKLPMSSAE